MNDIELELRAEVSSDKFNELINYLNNKFKQISHTKRLSAMFLGTINQNNFDIRVRIDSNGKAEIVSKKGDFHAHDRIETSQQIEKSQFLGIVKILSLFGFESKITERENFIFDLDNGVSLVLVKAGSIAYVEIEKMSNSENIEENRKELLSLAKDLGVTIIKDDKEFNELCDRLTNLSDKKFSGSNEEIGSLEQMLGQY